MIVGEKFCKAEGFVYYRSAVGRRFDSVLARKKEVYIFKNLVWLGGKENSFSGHEAFSHQRRLAFLITSYSSRFM